MKNCVGNQEVPDAEVPSVKNGSIAVQGLPQKNLHRIHSVKNGILQNDCFTSPKMDADFGKRKCSYAHNARLMNSQAKGLKKVVTKTVVGMLKITRQLGCVSQGMEPPKSSSILRKSSNTLKSIRCVRFTKAVLRHANIRDQNPSLGMICPSDPHQRNPNAPKIEDRSQEETEWQERCP